MAHNGHFENRALALGTLARLHVASQVAAEVVGLGLNSPSFHDERIVGQHGHRASGVSGRKRGVKLFDRGCSAERVGARRLGASGASHASGERERPAKY